MDLRRFHCWDCGFESLRRHGCEYIVSHVKVTATGRSPLQRIPTKCGVYECYFETSKMRRPKPTRAVKPWKKNPSDVFNALYQEGIPLWSSTLLFSTEHHTSYKAVLNLHMARCVVLFERLKREMVNHLTPNGHYMGRTAQLTSSYCILYIYSTNIRTEYFKYAA